VDAGSVAGAAVSAATGSAAYAPARQQAVDGVRSYAAQRSAHNQAQAAYNSATTRAGMAQRVDDLQTGQALTVNIDAPLASSVNGAQTRARVRVGGANLSFVQPPTSFGMPNRIRILINDLEVSTPGMDWVQSGNDMTWEVDLVSVVPVVLPLAIPVKRFSRTVPVPQAHRAAGLLPDDAVVSISVSDTPRSHPHNLSPAIAFPAGVPHSRHSLKASPWHPSLAVHPGLNTMAVIVADGSGRTAQSSVVFTMSSPASISGALTIVGVAYDAPEGEHIVIENISNTQVWLEGWTIRDLARHRLGLRPRYLAAGARLRIFTARGADDDTHLYMGRRRSVWNNTGDTAMLFDPEGHLTSSFTYVGGA